MPTKVCQTAIFLRKQGDLFSKRGLYVPAQRAYSDAKMIWQEAGCVGGLSGPKRARRRRHH